MASTGRGQLDALGRCCNFENSWNDSTTRYQCQEIHSSLFSKLSDVVFTGSVGGIEKLNRRESNTLTQDAIETKCNVAREHQVRRFGS